MTKLESVKAKIIEAVPEIAGKVSWHGAQCIKCKSFSKHGGIPTRLIEGDKDFAYGIKPKVLGSNLIHLNNDCHGSVFRTEQKGKPKRNINLEDVLAGLYKFLDIEPEDFCYDLAPEVINLWQLGKPLNLQNEALINFLHERLCQ